MAMKFNPITGKLDLVNDPAQISLSNNNLVVGGNSIDLSQYIDEDSRSIASGILNTENGVVTFIRDDSTTFTLDLSGLLDVGKIGDLTALKTLAKSSLTYFVTAYGESGLPIFSSTFGNAG